jgi:hypothetical protein
MKKEPKQIKDTRITNLNEIKNTIELLIEEGKTFNHIFSNYTNTIECKEFKTKWIKEERPKLMFMAYNKLMKDLNNNSKAQIINSKDYKTENYSNMESEEDFKLDHVINLDITACYPYTLYIHKLISRETLDYLLKLKKNERLPAIGMIAYQRLNYKYEDGILQDITHEKGPYQNIFFWIIETVNNLFLDIKEIAGPYYIMHWVDGVFLFPDVPLETLQRIEKAMTNWGYVVREESCRNFEFAKDGKKIDIRFDKGGKPKHYRFEDSNYKHHFNKVVKELHRYNQRNHFLSA